MVLGVLEVLAALMLAGITWQLPGSNEVHDTVGRVERVSQETGLQVRNLQKQVHLLSERRPQLQQLARRLQVQMKFINDDLRHQRIDYSAIDTTTEALGDVAAGLDGLSEVLDPRGIGEITAGLRSTADFLDNKVVPAATRAADQLDKTTGEVQALSKHLKALLDEGPLNLEATRSVYNSLGKFNEGMDRLSTMLMTERIETMREGFKGLETSLTSGANEVARLSGYTYPLVTFAGLKPMVEQKPFWPEGEKIADGMRKASKGAAAGSKELENLARDLPKLRESLDESRKVAAFTRQALGEALKQQEKVGPLLKTAPPQAVDLTRDLPQLSADLAKVLHDTTRLKEVADLLRKAQQGMDTTIKRWPELRKNLNRSATLLRNTQSHLRTALGNRTQYEESLKQTLLISQTFSAALPLLTEQLEQELGQQEQSLANLGDSINEVNAVLPECSQTAVRLLHTTRLLLGLVALIIGLHGCYLTLSTWLSPATPARPSPG
jgi:chromosome segregation ATPase